MECVRVCGGGGGVCACVCVCGGKEMKENARVEEGGEKRGF